MEDKEIINNIYSEDKDIKREAILKLREKPDFLSEEVIRYLLSLLNSNEPAIVDAVYNVLIEIDNDFLSKELIKLLATENIKVRSYIFEILNQKGKKSINNLVSKLNSKDPNERKFAVDILGEINADDKEENIISLLDDEDANVRFAAVEALSKIGGKKSVEALFKHLEKEKEVWVKYAIIEALSKIGDSEIAYKLIKFPLYDDIYIFNAVIETVSKIGDKDIIISMFEILPLVGVKEKLYIITAVFNLIKKYGEDILDKLTDTLSIKKILMELLREDIKDKSDILLLLSYFLDTHSYYVFLPYLNSSIEREINAAVIGLKRLKNVNSIEFLLEIFPYHKNYIKLNILEALSNFKSIEIKRKLMDYIDNENDTLKLSIFRLLMNYYDDEIEKLFEELLKKYKDNEEFIFNLKKIKGEFNKGENNG